MNQVKSNLDPVALKALQDARNAVAQLKNAGIPVETGNAGLADESKIVKPVHNGASYENFMNIDNLPSKGLFYEHTLSGQALKMEDILQVQTMSEDTVYQNFSEIYSRRLRGVTPDDMLVGDEVYIALWLRASSFPNSDHPSAGFTCSNEKCKFKVNDPAYEIKFNQITYSVDPSPIDLNKAYGASGFAEDVIKSSGKSVKIQLRRRYHTAIVNDFLNKEFYSIDKLPSEYFIKLVRLAVTVQIGNVTDIYDRINAIKNLNAEESYELITLINKYSFNVEPIINHICPKCGEVTSIKGYPFRFEEYLPSDYGKSS